MLADQKKIYAAINIGTLKVKSLFAYFEGDEMTPLFQSNNLTCFGCGMFEHGNQILDENLAATIKEILLLKEKVKEYNCQIVRLFATHALRDAANQKAVVDKIKERTGYEVEIIGPKEEGELYFRAAVSDLPAHQNFVIADIGGGSCQILIGDKDRLVSDYSFKTGALFLHESFTTDPHNAQSLTSEQDLQKMREYLIKEYSILPVNLGFPLIYGSSNIIDLMKTLKIPLEPYPDSHDHPYKVQAAYLSNFISEIIKFPYQTREEKYPFQTGYMWGVDKSFLNITTLAERFASPYILPSNANIVQGFLYKIKAEIDNKIIDS